MTGVQSDGYALTFTGEGFPPGYEVKAIVNGVESDHASRNFDTEVVASFSTFGVPPTTSVP